jgi:hypothetical protein
MSDLFDTFAFSPPPSTRSYGIVRYTRGATTHTERCPTRVFYDSMVRMAGRYGHSVVAVRLVTERPSSPPPPPRRRRASRTQSDPGAQSVVDLAAYRSAKAEQAHMNREEHAAD